VLPDRVPVFTADPDVCESTSARANLSKAGGGSVASSNGTLGDTARGAQLVAGIAYSVRR